MIDVTFSAPIEPKGAKRPRAVAFGGKARVYTPTSTTKWQQQLAISAVEGMRGYPVIEEAVRVDILAVLQRPKSRMRKVDPDGLVWAPTTPDYDNIAKNVCDGLRSFWRDDKLVTIGTSLKCYAEKDGRPRVVVRIRSASAFDPTSVAMQLGLIDAPASACSEPDARSEPEAADTAQVDERSALAERRPGAGISGRNGFLHGDGGGQLTAQADEMSALTPAKSAPRVGCAPSEPGGPHVGQRLAPRGTEMQRGLHTEAADTAQAGAKPAASRGVR